MESPRRCTGWYSNLYISDDMAVEMAIDIPASGRLMTADERERMEEHLRIGNEVIGSDSFQFMSRLDQNRFVAEHGAIKDRLEEDDRMRHRHSILESEEMPETMMEL